MESGEDSKQCEPDSSVGRETSDQFLTSNDAKGEISPDEAQGG